MSTIQISLHTNHEQRLYLKSEGITLTQSKKEEILSELRGTVEKDLYEEKGNYQFSTLLPRNAHRLVFSYHKKPNPEYHRSPVIIFEAIEDLQEQQTISPVSKINQIENGINGLQEAIDRDIASDANDRDAEYLNKLFSDYKKHNKEDRNKQDPEVIAFAFDIISHMNAEPPLYRGEYLIALRKLAFYFSDLAPLAEFLEGYYGKPLSHQEINLFRKGKRILSGLFP